MDQTTASEPALEPGSPFEEPPRPHPRPWGLAATLGFGLIVAVVYVVLQAVVGVVYGAVKLALNPELDVETLQETIGADGLFMSIALCVGAPICAGLTMFFAWLRPGLAMRDYLAFKGVGWLSMALWALLLFGLLLLSDGLTTLMGRPIVPEFMVQAYETAVIPPLWWIAVVIAAPVFEEIFFRGFLFRGIKDSRLGPAGAIGATAVIWALIHPQYDWYGMATIFVVGIYLGVVRLKTESVWPCVVLHGLMNAVATIQVALHLNGNA